MRRICCIVILLCSPTLTAAEESQSANTGKGVSADDISWWIGELDSELFDTRERSQKNLIKASETALPAVAQAARQGSLEASTRAINILLAWSESEEQDLVIDALEQLAEMQNHPKQARVAQELLVDVREEMALKEFKKLGGLYQYDMRVRNIMPVQRVQNRQVIIGAEWKGGIEGLKLLERMPHATTVSFHSPPLGDEALAILERMPQVKLVDLFGTKRMSQAAIDNIQEKLPGVTFDVRGPAFLGVQGSFGDHAEVGSVVPGSAADIAGIKAGDTITKFEGQEIKDFKALTALIAQHEAGDTVTLTILRQSANGLPDLVDVKVTFAQWGKNGAGAVDRDHEQMRNFSGRLPEPTKIQLDRR
jgi:hypothetical protein